MDTTRKKVVRYPDRLKLRYKVSTDNEMTALADDLRGYAEALDLFHKNDVGAYLSIETNGLLVLETSYLPFIRAAKLAEQIEEIVPLFADVQTESGVEEVFGQ